MANHQDKYKQIFDYLSAPQAPVSPEGVLAFGRKDLLVAKKIVDMSHNGLAKFVVISGGVGGKDAGNLTIPEAAYLGDGAFEEAKRRGVILPQIRLETEAKNGAQNVQNSIALMKAERLPYHPSLTALSHATSLRRLAAMAEFETLKLGDPIELIHRVPTDYRFDEAKPIDQAEALGELGRLINWPNHQDAEGNPDPWLGQQDVPANLVDFYTDLSAQK